MSAKGAISELTMMLTIVSQDGSSIGFEVEQNADTILPQGQCLCREGKRAYDRTRYARIRRRKRENT